MFKPHYSICINCDKERLLVVKAGLCEECNYRKKRNAKGVKKSTPISKMSRVQYKKNKTIQEVKKNYYPKGRNVSFVASQDICVD